MYLQLQFGEFVVMMSRPGEEPMERNPNEIWELMVKKLEDMKRRRSSAQEEGINVAKYANIVQTSENVPK